MIQKRPTFAPKPICLSSESAPFSPFCKYPLPFHVLVSALLFYFIRKSKHFRNDICVVICVVCLQKVILNLGKEIHIFIISYFWKSIECGRVNNVLKLKNRF